MLLILASLYIIYIYIYFIYDVSPTIIWIYTFCKNIWTHHRHLIYPWQIFRLSSHSFIFKIIKKIFSYLKSLENNVDKFNWFVDSCTITQLYSYTNNFNMLSFLLIIIIIIIKIIKFCFKIIVLCRSKSKT